MPFTAKIEQVISYMFIAVLEHAGTRGHPSLRSVFTVKNSQRAGIRKLPHARRWHSQF